MTCVASYLSSDEDQIVPQVIQAILSTQTVQVHTALKYTGIRLLGQLDHWIDKHPQDILSRFSSSSFSRRTSFPWALFRIGASVSSLVADRQRSPSDLRRDDSRHRSVLAETSRPRSRADSPSDTLVRSDGVGQ